MAYGAATYQSAVISQKGGRARHHAEKQLKGVQGWSGPREKEKLKPLQAERGKCDSQLQNRLQKESF